MALSSAVSLLAVRGGGRSETADLVAVEAPLEIRVRAAGEERPLAITMRTPGHDAELAVGFLFTEGLLSTRDALAAVKTVAADTVVVDLADGWTVPERRTRSFTVTAACGVCGRGSIDDLRATPPGPLPARGPHIDAARVPGLPEALRAAQAGFGETGGLHAAGLFDAGGRLRLVREDVGRHNAVDKVVGALWLAGQLPAADAVLVVSGRASFELVQKALMAQVPVLAAVGAPSSLAVSLAVEADMTLLGFVREQRFNVYAGGHRLGL